jgi:hypothetical protein
MFLRKVGIRVPNYMLSHPKVPNFNLLNSPD